MPVSETPEGVVTDEFNRLRGRLCGLIESFGLPDKQERGCINTLKSLSYDSEAVIKALLEDTKPV